MKMPQKLEGQGMVDRFHVETATGFASPKPVTKSPTGNMVRYEDYAALSTQLEAPKDAHPHAPGATMTFLQHRKSLPPGTGFAFFALLSAAFWLGVLVTWLVMLS
jgi:hypothetical protein